MHVWSITDYFVSSKVDSLLWERRRATLYPCPHSVSSESQHILFSTLVTGRITANVQYTSKTRGKRKKLRAIPSIFSSQPIWRLLLWVSINPQDKRINKYVVCVQWKPVKGQGFMKHLLPLDKYPNNKHTVNNSTLSVSVPYLRLSWVYCWGHCLHALSKS